MFSLYAELPRAEEEMEAHAKALAETVLSEEHKDLFDHLYSCLSILDSKSASMLTFNSLVIAVFAIFMTHALTQPEWVVVNIGMATTLVSAFLLVSVVWVHWSPTRDLKDAAGHVANLLKHLNSRTIRYRLAWYLALGSLVMLSAFLVLRVSAGQR